MNDSGEAEGGSTRSTTTGAFVSNGLLKGTRVSARANHTTPQPRINSIPRTIRTAQIPNRAYLKCKARYKSESKSTSQHKSNT